MFHVVSETIERTKQIVGYNEDILDVCFVGETESLAVASNSEQIRIYNRDTIDCTILYGHSDMVLSLTSSHDKTLLVSGSKDNTVLIWDAKDGYKNIGSCVGHTSAVSAVGMSKLSNKWILSASHDRTLKLWDITSPTNPKSKFTVHAHEGDIQCVDISPNDKLIVSCGLDKTAKLWSMDATPLGTFKGHKRGIWGVKFSPVDQMIATCSTDKTIKLWSLTDFTCLKVIADLNLDL